MGKFETELKKLNKQQRAAVENIEGPQLVLAGPGTGKTQLLSMRVANIIKQTDVPPGSVLCLTFTDSAARTMRKRLIELMGEEAYHVAIHTFHSFGLEVINRYPEIFADRAGYQPIDEVTQFELIDNILSHLPRRSPLATRDSSGQLIWQKSIAPAISQLKKSGLEVEDFRALLDENEAFLEIAEPMLNEALTGTWRGKAIDEMVNRLANVRDQLENETDPGQIRGSYPTLKTKMIKTIDEALETAPHGVRQFRSDMMIGTDGNRKLRDREQLEKLRDLAVVYEQYQNGLARRRLHDYDDQILAVIKAMEDSADLKADLQERYLYVLVDEFQDTSDAQLQMLLLLGDNPVAEGRPDIMAVGDDDQAIYRFQGAEVSNLLTFKNAFRQTAIQPLEKNYRSTPDIVQVSDYTIGFCHDRLVDALPGVTKRLKANRTDEGTIRSVELPDANSERHFIGQEINRLIKQGVQPNEIAVIGRQHQDLIDLMPHIDQPIIYERRDDVLAQPLVKQLIQMAKTVAAIKDMDRNALKDLLPEILTYDFWQVEMADIWKLSWQAHQRFGSNWLDMMIESDNPKLKLIADFLLETARRETVISAEELLDILMGNTPVELNGESYTSPFKSFHFSHDNYEKATADYLDMLSALTTLRRAYREWSQAGKNRLMDFISFIDMATRADIRITDSTPHRESESAVNLITAHSAKGQEFEAVFILHANQEHWDKSKRGGTSISWPMNLPIGVAGDAEDDRTRLFYVSLTRAKSRLYLTNHSYLPNGKASTKLRLLTSRDDQPAPEVFQPDELMLDGPDLSRRLDDEWRARHLSAGKDELALLKEKLETYQMSPTDLNAYIDVTSGGPRAFLIHNLLKFPRAKPPTASLGTAVHEAIALAHSSSARSEAAVKANFRRALEQEPLSELEFQLQLEHGEHILGPYVKVRQDSFQDDAKVEQSFYKEGVVINDARLTGRLDKMVLQSGDWKKGGALQVIDWKTGKPHQRWTSNISLHKNRQQLLFYKLLVENSRTYSANFKVGSAVLEFVNAPAEDKPALLSLSFEEEKTQVELEKFTKLVQAVWSRIMALDFPDTSSYKTSLTGIKQFEKDLLGEKDES